MPEITAGWGASFPKAVYFKSFEWDGNDNFLLTGTPTNQFNIFLNVTQSGARQILYASNPDTAYVQMSSTYPCCLLTENCTQLITESGSYLVI